MSHIAYLTCCLTFSLSLVFGQGKKSPSMVTTAGEQSKTKDVGGWDKVKWGMSFAQVQAAYGAVAHEDSNGHAKRLVIEAFNVGNIKMKVSIETPSRESDEIREVTLSMPESNLAAKGGGSVRHRAYEGIMNALIQKYGPPVIRDIHQGGTMVRNSALWSLPSTIMFLEWLEAGDIELGELSLRYTVMVHNLFRRSRHAISRRVSRILSVLGDNAGESAARLG